MIDIEAIRKCCDEIHNECIGMPSAQLGYIEEKLCDIMDLIVKGLKEGEQMSDLTRGEAYAVAEFIDYNIFSAIRSDTDWDSFQALRNLVHAYEKCSKASGYVGATDTKGTEA